MLVCGTLIQNALWESMIAYFFISQTFYVKFSQNVWPFSIQKVFGFVNQITVNKVSGGGV